MEKLPVNCIWHQVAINEIGSSYKLDAFDLFCGYSHCYLLGYDIFLSIVF